MKLDEINNQLQYISMNIEGLDILTNEKIEELSKKVSNLQNMDVFDKSDEIETKKGDTTLTFEETIEVCLEGLEFDRKSYISKLMQENNNDYAKCKNIADVRQSKISELTSKIARMGLLNTAMRETMNIYNEKDFDKVFETKDRINASRLEDENKKIIMMSKYNDEIKNELDALDYIKEVEKLENENNKITNEIINIRNQKSLATQKEDEEALQELIDQMTGKIKDNLDIINSRNAIINWRTVNDIKNQMLSKLPAELRQPEVEAAINSDNPREAYNKLISKSQNEILKYQNRIDKNAEMKDKFEIGRETRDNLRKAKPVTYKAEDYSLDDDELLAIEEEIKNGGDRIDELVEKATNEINSLPIPAGKDLRKQAKAWLDMQNGETKNPFKNIARRIKSYSEKTQNQYMDAYKKQQINEKVKNALIDEKKIEKFNSMIETKKTETKAKMQPLDNRYNSFKESLYVNLSKLSNDELDDKIQKGKFGELAVEQYNNVAEKEICDD